MNEFLINAAISTVLLLLKQIPKKGTDKRKWRKVMLKIYNAIGVAYSDDAEFRK